MGDRKTIKTVGELIGFLKSHCNMDDSVYLDGDCDGGCGYHWGFLMVNGDRILGQAYDDDNIREW